MKIEMLDISPHIYVQLTYDKEVKNVQIKTVFLINGAGKIEQLYVKG